MTEIRRGNHEKQHSGNSQAGSNIRYFPQQGYVSSNRANFQNRAPYTKSVHSMHTKLPGSTHADYPGNVREFPSRAVTNSFVRAESRQDAQEQKSADKIGLAILGVIVLCGIFLPMVLEGVIL